MRSIIGINGSPRPNWNSARLLDSALAGAAHGAKTVRADLFRMQYMGCVSCFACKRLGSPSFGKCAVPDAIQPLLSDILNSDGLIVSAPVYFSDVPGAVRNLYERLWFPGLTYSTDGSTAYKKRIPVILIYTMNAGDASMYENLFASIRQPFEWLLGPVTELMVTDTLQFPDYSQYASAMFSEAKKRDHYDRTFPSELAKAAELGRRLAKGELGD